MCLWTCKRRALLKAYYMVCDTMETVSGIIVLSSGQERTDA